LEKQRPTDKELAMASSKDGLGKCSAVLEYIKSLDEVEREMYERFKQRTRERNGNDKGQGIVGWTELSGQLRKDNL
jgi:hypothetical protein